jgi:hypothetical protein
MRTFVPSRVTALALIALAALLAPPIPRSAAGPTREVIPLPEDFVLEEACAFPVMVHSEGKIVLLTWTDASGDPVLRRNQLFPGTSQTFTNQETGASLVILVPGPGFLKVNGDGSSTFVGTGPWSWYPQGPGGGNRASS